MSSRWDPQKEAGITRTVACIDLAQIGENTRVLADMARASYRSFRGAVAMVKSNAYGHGAIPVARALEAEGDVLALGVATFQEGLELRANGLRKPVWIFGETTPWTEAHTQLCVQHKLTPVLHTAGDVRRFLEYRKGRAELGFHLKFNTGLNRLGIDPAEFQEVRKLLEQSQTKAEGICTHLAMAEKPKEPLTRQQVERFRALTGDFSSLVSSYIHCANSSGLLEENGLKAGAFCNVVRPGIGLYGYADSPKSKTLKPALRWFTQVLRARDLKAGDRVGYGGIFKAKGRVPSATVGIGYGDGFFRAHTASPLLVGVGDKLVKTDVLGRVSMDLTVLRGKFSPGQWLCLVGEQAKQAEQLAKNADTIVYEILTRISSRVPRIYI